MTASALRWTLAVLCLGAPAAAQWPPSRNNLSRTPPMGWMSWEVFRCNVDCAADPHNCLNEQMHVPSLAHSNPTRPLPSLAC